MPNEVFPSTNLNLNLLVPDLLLDLGRLQLVRQLSLGFLQIRNLSLLLNDQYCIYIFVLTSSFCSYKYYCQLRCYGRDPYCSMMFATTAV